MMLSVLRTAGKGARSRHALYSTAKTVGSQPRVKWPPTIGIVLSGCGAMDGSEIHEAVSLQTQIQKHCAKFVCYAPDEPQVEVINSLTETPMKERRNIITEASRLTPSSVSPLEQMDKCIEELDAVVFCGGQGAVNNLTSFFRNSKCPLSIHPNVQSIIKKCHTASKPMGFISETSIIAANELPGVMIALEYKRDRLNGEKYKKIADALGAKVSCNGVSEVCCDYGNRVFSVPAFMCRKSKYHDVYDGIGNMVRVMLATMKHGIDCPVRPVIAVVHGTASLPCDITPPIPHDPLDTVILVVWYKNEKTAIYSVDIRGKHVDPTKSHWKDETLEGRSHFRTLSEPATLSIDNVSEMDAGVYRCRVDFKKSPTRNTRLNLTVIVPPRRPSILTENGEEIQNQAGPYFEGDRVKLTCIVTGGQPEPSVRWWRGETLVDSGSGEELSSKYFTTSSTTFRHNQLTIDSLTRNDQGAVYTCQASNSNLSAPVSASVTIEMYLKPLKVEVLSSRQPLSAGRSYEVQCQSGGSKPPANITWWKDNEKLTNFTQTVSADGQVTSSTLVFRPEKTDNGKAIVCRAENEHVQQEVDGTYGAEEDSWTIDVHFVPLLKLALGINMNPMDIEEGDDVYFECKIDSNPPAYKVVWKHNGQVIQGNVKGGVIMTQKDLALQNVKRQQAGNYSCLASNVEGDGESNIVRLTAMYKPVCKNNQKLTYGVARNENTEILCEVDAYPAPDVFKWTFNRTGAVASDVAGNDIMPQQSRFGSSGLETSAIRKSRMSSVLNYSPSSPSSGIGGGGVNDGDYGTVTCRATNSAGQQLEPCVFHVIAAVKPDPPFNCTTSERTPFSMRVWCAQGFDGGVTQKFTLEVYDAGDDPAAVIGDEPTVAADGPMPPLLVNMSADEPDFIIRQLTPAVGLRLAVYAHNSRGTSERTWLTAYTLNAADKQTTSGSSVAGVGAGSRLRLTPIVATLVGITIVAAAIAAVVMCALRMRSHRDRIRRRQELCGDNGCIMGGTAGGSAAIAVGKQKADGNSAAALDSEKNPDIIPPTKIKNSNRNNIGYHPVQQQMDSNVDIDIEALETETSDDERAGYPVDQIDGVASRHSINTLRRAAAPVLSGYRNVGYRPEQHNMATTSVTTRLPKYHHREIVTVMTPLMSSQQESCV